MLRTPGLFHAGAAVAAVTDKRLYDTLYTERYLGVLQDNEEGYKKSSPLFAADQLEGKLLIAHGISDDNVHVQNAYNLVEALNKAEKDYQLYLYPQKKHGIGGNDVRFHLYQRILDFFVSTLAPKAEN
jgi:dipeptidyl-peptidase-4